MKIALLCPFFGEKKYLLEALYSVRGLEALLNQHEVRRFSAFETDRAALIQRLNRFDAVIFLGGLFEASPARWRAEDLRKIATPVIPLSLGLPGRYPRIRDGETTAMLQLLAKQGPLSAAEWATQQWLTGELGKRAVQVTGCPTLFLETIPIRLREPRTVFCPIETDAGFSGSNQKTLHRMIRSFYRRISKSQRALYLAHTAQELTLGAVPGNATLFVPDYPVLHLKAIVSAAAVVSFHPLPAVTAVANRVPGVMLGNDSWSKSVAESAGIPFLEVNTNTNSAELKHRVEDTIAKYPWERVNEKTAALRDNFVSYLKERGIPLKTKSRVRPTTTSVPSRPSVANPHNLIQIETGPALNVCSISDSAYFPFFVGLVENLLATHSGPVHFHLLALDKKAEASARLIADELPLTVHTLSDLWNADELPRILERDVGFRAFSSKPRLIARALGQSAEPVLYCDSDVFFHGSPVSIFSEFGTGSALLFPHWNDDFTAARRDGLYNAGMLAVRPGAEPFLDWWGKLCLDRCEFAQSKGYVGDQGYLDFAPIYFEGVHVYRGADQNVARWNLTTLGIAAGHDSEDGPSLFDGRPVQSYHAAFVDDNGFFEMKFAWDQLVHFFGSLKNAETLEPLYSNTLAQQKKHWLGLARFLNLHRMLGEHFLPLAHKPRSGQIRFFVSGMGRHLLHAMARLRAKGDNFPQGAGTASDTLWTSLQRTRIGTPSPAPEITDTVARSNEEAAGK